MAEKMPSSTRLGSRPRILTMRAYSSPERLCSATRSGVITPGASACGKRVNDRLEHLPSHVVAEKPFRASVRMGHQTDDVALPAGDARDIGNGAVGVGGFDDAPFRITVPEDDTPLPLEV